MGALPLSMMQLYVSTNPLLPRLSHISNASAACQIARTQPAVQEDETSQFNWRKESQTKFVGASQFHRAIRTFSKAISLCTSPVPLDTNVIRNNAHAGGDSGNTTNCNQVCMNLTSYISRTLVHPIMDQFGVHMKNVCKRVALVVFKSFEEDIVMPHTSNRPKQLLTKTTIELRELMINSYNAYVDASIDNVIEMCKQDADAITEYHDMTIHIREAKLRAIEQPSTGLWYKCCMPSAMLRPTDDNIDLKMQKEELQISLLTPEKEAKIKVFTQHMIEGMREYLKVTSAAKAHHFCMNTLKFKFESELLHQFDLNPGTWADPTAEIARERAKMDICRKAVVDISACLQELQAIM